MHHSNTQKHLVFVFRDMGTGGAQKVQAFVANTCLNKGYKVSAISTTDMKVTVDLDESIPVYVVNLYPVSDVSGPRLRRFFERIVFLLNLRKRIRGLKPDLLVVFLPDVVRMTVLSTKGYGIPILASERSDPFQYDKKRAKKYAKAYNQCSEVVFQLENAKKGYDLKPSLRISVIPNPCIPRVGAQFNSEEDDVRTGKYILSAGRLCQQKRFDVLIRAFSVLHKECPEYKLVIFGEGDERVALEGLIDKEGLVGKVLLPGETADPFNAGIEAEMFALSSDYEGIPNVLIEAMGHGIPCISTDCSPGGAAFLLDHGRRGMLVPLGDWQALGEGMIKLLENEALRQQYSRTGFEIFELFRPQAIKDLWLGAVSRCLTEAPMTDVRRMYNDTES